MAQYYMMNKPQGLVSARSDAWRPTVMSLLPPALAEVLHPVGRLDKDTEGLLLFTDDGMLDRHLLRPEHHIEKGYLFRAFGKLTEADFAQMAQGVVLYGSGAVSKPARAELVGYETVGENISRLPEIKRNHFLKNPGRPVTVGRLWLTEGRKHEVKLMVKAVGGHVFFLERFSVGDLQLDGTLLPGQYRPLTEDELQNNLGYFTEGQKSRMKYGIIWDLDGTMWDSGEQVSAAWNEYTKAHGIDRQFTPGDCRSYCGRTLEQIAAIVFPDAEPAWREKVIIECCDAECIPLAKNGGQLYDGLKDVLAALHEKYHLSVVSNCGLGYIEAFFTGNKTQEFFDDYENAARTGLGKAENIRLVMERNGLDRAIYIGDTQGDCSAAKQAGVDFVLAAYGFGDAPEAQYRIDSLRELPALAEKIFGA